MKELKCGKCGLVIPRGVTCRIKQIHQSKAGNVDVEQVEHINDCTTVEGKDRALEFVAQDKKLKESLNVT